MESTTSGVGATITGHDLVRRRRHGRRLSDDLTIVGGDEDDGMQRGDHGRRVRVQRRARGHAIPPPAASPCCAEAPRRCPAAHSTSPRAASPPAHQRGVSQPLPLAIDVRVQRQVLLLGLLVLQRDRDPWRAALVLRAPRGRTARTRRTSPAGSFGMPRTDRGGVRVGVAGAARDLRPAATAAEDGDRRQEEDQQQQREADDHARDVDGRRGRRGGSGSSDVRWS